MLQSSSQESTKECETMASSDVSRNGKTWHTSFKCAKALQATTKTRGSRLRDDSMSTPKLHTSGFRVV